MYLCPTGCKECLSKSVCETCGDGFILDTDTDLCTRCKGSCKTCDSSDADVCLTCFPGSYKSGDNCMKCSDSCRECTTSVSNCITCNVG